MSSNGSDGHITTSTRFEDQFFTCFPLFETKSVIRSDEMADPTPTYLSLASHLSFYFFFDSPSLSLSISAQWPCMQPASLYEAIIKKDVFAGSEDSTPTKRKMVIIFLLFDAAIFFVLFFFI